MTPEEFERIKQAEKEHLRKLKKLKEAHRQLERQKKVTEAVTDMTSSMQEKLDVHADMMDKIGTDSALNEARLEMAMESSARAEQEAQEMKDEQTLAKEKAKELVRQMKMGAGLDLEIPESDHKTEALRSADSADTKAPTSTSRGRTEHQQDDTSENELPEKTIGRMKP